MGDLVLTSGVFFGLSSSDPDDASPPRIPPVRSRDEALARTEALLQALLRSSQAADVAATASSNHDLM